MPRPPRPADTVLSFATAQDFDRRLPATVEFSGMDPFGHETRFRTLEPITIVPARLRAVQFHDEKGFHDLTDHLLRRELVYPFGSNPKPGTTLYLGFDRALPSCAPVSLFFTFSNSRSGEEERLRLIREAKAQQELCRPSGSLMTCQEKRRPSLEQENSRTLAHHSVRTVWEFLTTAGSWKTLDPTERQVKDETRNFTLNGRVLFKISEEMGKKSIGSVPEEWYYLRFRFVSGTYDAPPQLANLAMNGVRVEQAVPVPMTDLTGAVTWTIAKNAIVKGPAPTPGKLTHLKLQFDPQNQEIVQLTFTDDDKRLPRFTVLEYREASGTATGHLRVEAIQLGYGDGRPYQELALPEAPVQQSSFQLFTLEGEKLYIWQLRADFDASKRSDRHLLLDSTQGIVMFGDGEKGHVPPTNTPVYAAYRATRAEAGNLGVDKIKELTNSPHNRALLGSVDDVKKQFASIANPIAAQGGAAAETLPHAIGRAIELVEAPQRAVTLQDYETLAEETPGVQLARVSARANLHPSFPCFKAPGLITLLVLPYLPVDRPMPSQGLLQAVRAYLTRRRVIGTRVEVVGPTYLEVAVQAKVQACVGVNKTELQQRIVDALNRFFHPLQGGPDGVGWPFGRDVYRSEVLQVIDETVGVDHVLSLELIPEGKEPQCGNVCLGPLGLVAAGQHQIEVL
ncbi:putative baseplate assembly protein [Candidatus Acetothermia bacterium]|nr:putative baseplate assembly protein [Candidatus Acetothermia bacterium]